MNSDNYHKMIIQFRQSGIRVKINNYFPTLVAINNTPIIFDEKNGLNKLKSHFYLTGGYTYEINRDYKIEPSILIKGTAPKNFQFDLTSRVIYQDMVWGGLSYRMKDAVSLLLGYIYDDKFYFGYSYDMGITGLRRYNSGSHELMIGYRFNDIK